MCVCRSSVKSCGSRSDSDIGYDFPNAEAILPFLEEPETGQTSQFCKALASRLKCYVAAGYPERLSEEEKDDNSDAPAVGANSAVLYSPDGLCVGGYRKVNMFETDKTWAKPGTSLNINEDALIYLRVSF